jgi:ADP-ribose pyrophosphatase
MMKRCFVIFALVLTQVLFANQETLAREHYFSYLRQLSQSEGNFQKGEIQIVLDAKEIAKVEALQKNRLQQKGLSQAEAEQFSRTGVVCEDQYLMLIRDAVYFPKGIPGTYDRIIWKTALEGSYTGVAVMPVLANGRIVLNLNYRHATRSWELELPRGGILTNETKEAAALREVKEETGCIASAVTYLGEMAPDTGILSAIIPVFMGKVKQQETSSPEYSEAIGDVIAFTKDELKKGILQGFLEVSLHGEKKCVPLRDPFLTFALFQAELRDAL